MPHIIVKLYAGKSEQLKEELTEKIVKSVVDATKCKEAAVSVAIEEFKPHDWAEKVYKPDILDKEETLSRKPGYNPFSDKTEEKDETVKPNLNEYISDALIRAAQEDTSGIFSPMSWMDLELEDNPQSFDPFFDTPWNELSDLEKKERMMAVRREL